MKDNDNWIVTRRMFLKRSGLVVAGVAAGTSACHGAKTDKKAKISFGIVTDAHFADIVGRGARKYNESIPKMKECVELMNDKKVDFLVELGDFKDQGKPVSEKKTLEYLETIEKTYAAFKGPRYHVLGNHDVDSISKKQFMARVTNTKIPKTETYYSFDAEGLHFVVLDANYDSKGVDYDHGKFNWTDSNIPPKELAWLKKDLAATSKPTILFVHQQLDVKRSTGVKNAPAVRKVLQDSKKVLAVFQGHHHAGHYSHIENIHYYTLKAMVDGTGKTNNSYAIVEVHNDNSITVNGYRKAISQKLKKA
ncbi:MAG: hypothetical protein HN350_16095 [Phycisphaerales bacterium]|nr:hypothetical protein [Phycisphaerales bacterium]